MVEEVGLKVRIISSGQAGAMNKIADQTAAGVRKGTEKGFKSAKLPGPLQKFANGKESRGAASGGLGGAAVAGGVAGLVMAGVQGLTSIMGKMFSTLVESSGALKGVMKQLNVGFMQIVRPMGDLIATLLRPVALFFRTIGREINKQFRAWRRANPNATAADQSSALMDIYGKVFTDALSKIDWAKLFKFLSSSNPDKPGDNIFSQIAALLGNPFAQLVVNWPSMIKGLENVWNSLVSFVTAFNNVLGGAWSIMTTTKVNIDNIMKGLSVVSNLIYDAAVGFYNSLAKVANALGANLQLLPTSAEIAAAKRRAEQAALDAGNVPIRPAHASAYRESEFPRLASGGEITRTGAAIVHQGEVVLNPQQQASGMSATIVIPGSAIADAIDRRVDHYYRTRIAARRG